MADLTTIVSAVAGGLISGLAGTGIVEYRVWKDDLAKLESWHTKAIRLSERVINAEDEVTVGAFQTAEKLPHIRNTCAGVHTMMAEHLTDAPSDVDSEVIERCEELIQACQLVKDTGIEQNDFLPNFRQAQDTAEEVVSEVRSKV